MVERIAKAFRHPISQNVVALYWVQIATFLIPLATLPYVARVLGPDEFGVLVFAQGLSFLLGVIVEWGFTAVATREAAGARHDTAALTSIASRVLGGKAIMSVTALAVAVVVFFTATTVRDHPDFLVLAWSAAVAVALTPNWYFVGLERLRLVSLIQLSGRLVSAGLTFVLVREADDGWIVMALYAGSAAAVSIIVNVMMYRSLPLRLPTLRTAIEATRSAWVLFVGTVGAAMYTSLNVVLLGLFAPSGQVAHFGAAERLVRTTLQILGPLGTATYPRLAYLQASGRRSRARRLTWMIVGVFGGVGLAVAVVLAVFAPFFVNLLFGPEFDEAVPLLRLLVILVPPFIVAGTLGGWLLSLHEDKAVVRIVLQAGLLNVVLAVILAPLFGPTGMACSVICAEIAAALGAVRAIRRHERGQDSGLFKRPRDPGRDPL